MAVCSPNIRMENYSRTHVIRILRGPRNLFELHDYSNYRSSDYMSSTVIIRLKIRTYPPLIYAKLSNMESEKMVIREIILKVNLFWDLCMQTIENIPKNSEHVDNVPKRPENPDCNVQKVYPKFRHVPVWLYRGVPFHFTSASFVPSSILCLLLNTWSMRYISWFAF